MFIKQFNILLLLLLSWTLACCSTDDELCLDEANTEAEVDVLFRLSIDGDVDQSSRGTWNDNLDPNKQDYPEEVGTAYDNKIQTGSIQVLVYKEQEYVGKVENVICVPLANGTEYQFVGEFPKNKLSVGTDYKFMVFANSKKITSTDFSKLSFQIDDIQENTQNFIPMWGVCKVNLAANATGQLETSYDIGTIYLLRSVSKVQVRLSDEMAKSFTLESVQINVANPSGYVLPSSWNTVPNTLNLSHESEAPYPSFRPLTSTQLVSYAFKQDKVQNIYGIYLPEFDNKNAAKEAVVEVKVKDKATNMLHAYNNSIKFREYVNGDASGNKYNISRNCIYKYTINKIVAGNKLALTCTVNPWNVLTESWNFTEQVSVVGGKITWVDQTYQALNKQNATVTMAPGVPLRCNFRIDTPKFATWHASFIPLKGSEDAFRFFTSPTQKEGVKELQGEVGKPASLTIIPTQTDITETNIALLKIIVRTQDGRTILVKSLMPDESVVKEGYTIIQSH